MNFEYSVQLAVCFSLGLLLESFINIRPLTKKNFIKFLLVFLGSFCFVFFMRYIDDDEIKNPNSFDKYIFPIIFFCIIFSVAYSQAFKKLFLPIINKYVIISLIVLFWYIYLDSILIKDIYGYSIAFVFFVFTILVIKFLNINNLSNSKKIFLYIIFLITSTFLLLIQIIYSDFYDKIINNPSSVTKLESFFAGIIFMYFFLYLIYVAETGMLKFDTFKKKPKYIINWFEQTRLFIEKYKKISVRNRFILILLLGSQIVSAIFNLIFNFSSSIVFVGFWLFIFPLAISMLAKEIYKKDINFLK